MLHHTLGFLRRVYDSRRQVAGLPRFLTYTVTFGCNARCIMCDSWKKSVQGDLQLDEIESIFRQLPRMDAVRLTGGEPFVRRDFAEIASLTERRLNPLYLHITTNGFLTDRIVTYCEQRPKRTPLQLLISVDGVGEKHNAVRGSSIAWNSVLETIQSLAPRQRSLGLRLMVNQTIVDAEGVEHYRKLRELLRPYGVYNNVVMAYDASATYSLQSEVDLAPKEAGQFTTFGEFNADHVGQLVDAAEHDLVDLPFFERLAKRYYLRGLRNRLLHQQAVPQPACVALTAHLRIFPNGDVPTCQFNSQIVGNLRETTFAELWSSATTARQRTWVARCPGCWAECEVLPSAIYSLDLLRKGLTWRRRRAQASRVENELMTGETATGTPRASVPENSVPGTELNRLPMVVLPVIAGTQD